MPGIMPTPSSRPDGADRRRVAPSGAALCGRRFPSGDCPMAQIAPAGEHEVLVLRATIESVPWRVFLDNPTGDALRLVLHAGDEFEPIRQDVSLGNLALLGVVAMAFGTDRYRLSPHDLVDKKARIVVKHIDRGRGPIAIVGRWVTAPRRDPLPGAFEFPGRRGGKSEAPSRRGKRPSAGQGDVCW